MKLQALVYVLSRHLKNLKFKLIKKIYKTVDRTRWDTVSYLPFHRNYCISDFFLQIFILRNFSSTEDLYSKLFVLLTSSLNIKVIISISGNHMVFIVFRMLAFEKDQSVNKFASQFLQLTNFDKLSNFP